MGEMQADLYVKDMENMAKRMTYCQRSRGGHVNDVILKKKQSEIFLIQTVYTVKLKQQIDHAFFFFF